MSHRSFIAALAAAFVLAAGPALAHSIKVGTLSLTDLWTRATPPGAPTAGGYLTIENSGETPDRLTGAASPVAGRVEIHEMTTEGGTMIMRPAGSVEIPAGATVTLAPGGFHIMFMELKETLAEGERMPVTLDFERAGRVETFLHVLAIGARTPEGDHEHGPGQ